MKALVIDDEKNSSELTLNLLRDYCPLIQVLSVASSVEEGYRAIMQFKPELVFLDIQMQDGTGFDLLNRFSVVDFKIVFITAHESFALDAFRRSAIDYLLKPISPPDIIQAVDKALQYNTSRDWNGQLRALLDNLSEPLKHKQKLVLKTLDRVYSLHLDDIIRFRSEGSYTEVFLKDHKKIVVSKLLKEFDELLSNSGFLRVHQSHLININYIFCFEKSENLVFMKDESQVPVSIRKKENLLSLLNSL